MAMDVEVIWVKSELEYFCSGGWTGESAICSSGTLQGKRLASCPWLSFAVA
jgi:hypothetical protein